MVHGLVAAAIAIAAVIALVTVERNRRVLRPLAASARVLVLLTGLQMLLGAVALFDVLPLDGTPRPTTLLEAIVRTSHQTGGALILAASVVLWLRAYRHLVSRASRETGRSIEAAGSARRTAPGGLDWEAAT
jgi:cytochrome c oxidase assembly protein subunit 15